MHVISASRRTDIPAFHAEWLYRRIRDGTVRVKSPFGGKNHRVSLVPSDVVAFVFWTKNAAPLLPYLDRIRSLGHCFTFLYTVNNYPKSIEPHVPDLETAISVLGRLSAAFPESIVRWRYDPIVLSDETDEAWHRENFRLLCERMAPFTSECIFSFCDYYRKTIRNMRRCVPGFIEPHEQLRRESAEELAKIASQAGIRLLSCSHDELVSDTIGKAACIDPSVLFKIVDSDERRLAVSKLKKAPSRKQCGCAASRDIGAYDTCGHGCAYCYANSDTGRARSRMEAVTPNHDCLDYSLRGDNECDAVD